MEVVSSEGNMAHDKQHFSDSVSYLQYNIIDLRNTTYNLQSRSLFSCSLVHWPQPPVLGGPAVERRGQ